MASAQEFSSPGEHMASIGYNKPAPGTIATDVGHAPGEVSNVIWSGNAYDNFNRGYSLAHDEDYGSSAYERAERYNDKYLEYNNSLFNSAKDYDMYMSNTAIQRQVEDLKKAGLNPILASRLGGATYKGVNAPYLSLSPSSALTAMLNYDSSMYATDVNSSTMIESVRMQNTSKEFISQFEQIMQNIRQGNLFVHENQLIELQKDADAFLKIIEYLPPEQLEKYGFKDKNSIYTVKAITDNSFEEAIIDYQHGNGTGVQSWLSSLSNYVMPIAMAMFYSGAF